MKHNSELPVSSCCKTAKAFSCEILAVWDDIRISRKENLLILENSRIRRILDLSKGAPRTVSLQPAG